MKKITKIFLLAISLCYCTTTVFSQDNVELAPGYYVVVSAYAKSREQVAINYVDLLKQKGYDAQHGFNTSRNLYFVYINYFTTLKESLQEMKRIRSKGEFSDAWVRVVTGDIQVNAPSTTVLATPRPVMDRAKPKPVQQSNEINQQQLEDSLRAQASPVLPDVEITDTEEIVQHEKMTLGNTEVFLSLFNGRNNRIVDGEVQVVDTDRTRAITKVKGNEYLLLPDPKSTSGQLTLICEAFGYRKVQHEINYPLPLADTVKSFIDLMGTTVVVNFDLVRYHKGDIATLYNVYFYNDAALMLPESKFELGSLLQLMQENPRYRIKLHGHSNGNYHGKILSVGPDKNYFSLEGAKQGSGSATDLSRERAEVIKDYLVSNGIDAARMEIKAWGGKRPLYDKRSANAKKNVRVEVEILQE